MTSTVRQSEIAEKVTEYIFSLPHWDKVPISELQEKAMTIARFLESGEEIPDNILPIVDKVVPKWEAVEILRQCWALLYVELEDEPDWDQLRGWQLLLHAREYLEGQL